MRKLIVILFVIYFSNTAFCQTAIRYGQLTFKKEIAYYKNKLYNGYACNNANQCFYFKNGLKEGKVRWGNIISTYNHNYITDVKFIDSTKQVLFQKGFKISDKITGVLFSVYVENELNDTLYKIKVQNKDSLLISVGLITINNRNNYSFIPAKDFMFVNCSVSGQCFVDWKNMLKKNYLLTKDVLRISPNTCESQELWIENIKLSYLNQIFNVGARSIVIK